MAERTERAEPVLTRIGQAIMLHRAGDREEARNRLAALWAELGETADPFCRCTVAHYMADTQDEAEDELLWDLRALAAVEGRPGRGPASGRLSAAVRALWPALHLNLAADYARLGRVEEAREHFAVARRTAGPLPEDAYGDSVRAALARLAPRIDPDGASG